MSASVGQRFVVENRPAAGGNVGTAAVAKAAPDGYTIVMTASGPLAANKTLSPNLGYDPEKDFEPISLYASLPNIVVVNTKLPITHARRVRRLRAEEPQGRRTARSATAARSTSPAPTSSSSSARG